MSIPSHHLDAFLSLAQLGSFSKAAKRLNVTQSALSQRISNLEESLEQTLLIRRSSGIELTETGKKLLHFALTRESLEGEFLESIQPRMSETGFAGSLRIGGYSSVMRSVIIPSLLPFLRKNPKIQCEFITRAGSAINEMLQRAEIDLAITDSAINNAGFEEKILGQEKYVVIEPSHGEAPQDVYLDNGPSDVATELFFRSQGSPPPKYSRSFMGDIYGIMDGVAGGMGRAVACQHLLKPRMPVKILKRYRPLLIDVRLYYFSQPFYSQMFLAAASELTTNAGQYLQIQK